MIVRQLRCLTALCVVLVVAMAQPTVAAPVDHGNFFGPNVNYQNVTETTGSSDVDVLFGAPNSSGDALDFDPLGFSAQSQSGESDITQSSLTFAIEAKPARAITSIAINDSGDTTLVGSGSDATATQVSATATFHIRAVDGATISPISFPAALSYSPFGGKFRLLSEGGGGPFFTSPWLGELQFNVHQKLTDANIPFTYGATKIEITLDTLLTASSQATSSAQLTRKDFQIGTAVRLIGDYNSNNAVDAADYVVWRKGLGTTYSQPDYDAWRAYFGQAVGSGSGAIVPETATLPLLIVGVFMMCFRVRTANACEIYA